MSFFRAPPSRSVTPKHAFVLSVTVLLVSIPAAFAAHVFLYAAWGVALLYAGSASYLAFALSWSYLDRSTWRMTARSHNAFIVFAVCVVTAALLTGEDYSPFPRWATVLLIIAGVLAYSVAGYCAVKNIRRWRRGETMIRLG